MSNSPEMEDEVLEPHITTVKEVQEVINTTHPFGVKIWKPALYRKTRTVNKLAEHDILQSPGFIPPSKIAIFGNMTWTIVFGWWLSLLYLKLALIFMILYLIGLLLSKLTLSSLSTSAKAYAMVRCMIA
jgi:Ca2+:H+ antiporter